MRTRLGLLILISIALIFLACPKKKNGQILARVDGSTLTAEEMTLQIPAEYRQMMTQSDVQTFIDGWVDNELLYLEAKRLGIDKEDSVKMLIATWLKRILADAIKMREYNKITITEEEIQKYFEAHKDEFLYAVKVSQIILSTPAEAQKTLEEIKAGADFTQIARERSLGREVNPTGVTDYFTRGYYNPEIEEVVFRMKVGEISNIIPTPNGVFLIVKIIDRKKVKETIGYSEMREYILKSVLEPKRRREVVNSFLNQLRTTYKIEVHPELFRK